MLFDEEEHRSSELRAADVLGTDLDDEGTAADEERCAWEQASCHRSRYELRATFTDRPALGPEFVFVKQRARHSQFQHLRAALVGAERRLRKRWKFKQGDEEDHSVWVMFGDDDDLWHPRRAAEFVGAVLAHPRAEAVAAFATLARANVEREELRADDDMPTTTAEVNAFLSDGRATLLGEDDQCRVWLQLLRDLGEGASSIPLPEKIGLEYFDFYPRLRVVREFFDATSPSIVANRFCDLCAQEFFSKYPLLGRELGLEVSFFRPSSWLYFYANNGTSGADWWKVLEAEDELDEGGATKPASAGIANGHVSSDVPIGDEERRWSIDMHEKLRAFDSSISPAKLARYLAHFRYGMEVVLVRSHKQVLDQRELDSAIVDLAHTSFVGYLAKMREADLARSEEGLEEMYNFLRQFAKGMLRGFEVSVLWHRPDTFLPRELVNSKVGPQEAEESTDDVADEEAAATCADSSASEPTLGRGKFGADGSRHEHEVPQKVLDRWARSAVANGILSHFVIERELGATDSMSFRGFTILLDALGVELEQFVASFQGSSADTDVVAQTRRILLSFAVRSIEVQDTMLFPEIFELLQHLGLSRDDFLAAFRLVAPAELLEERADELLRDFLLDGWQAAGVAAPVDDGSATLDDVLRLLEALGVDLGHFVSIYRDSSAQEVDLLDEAYTLLRNFAKNLRAEEILKLKFRDVYLILELIGVRLVEFVAKFSNTRAFPRFIEEDSLGFEGLATLGRYRLRRSLCEGMTGSVLYVAEHTCAAVEGRRSVIVKYPARNEEVEALQALTAYDEIFGRHPPVGLPPLLEVGEHNGKPFIVTPLLGSSLDPVFLRLSVLPLPQRWAALRVMGRLVLRCLRQLHRRGLVHCDISPHNILLGPRRLECDPMDEEAIVTTLVLVDFGCARRWPGGGEVPGEEGSMEFSSVRSAAGGERRPQDDLEALAWMLVFGVCGELPWFPWLNEFYQLKSSLKEFKRAKLLERVADSKRRVLREGWGSFGEGWSQFVDVPGQLDAFLRACAAPEEDGEEGDEEEGRLPNYGRLLRLLGDHSEDEDLAAEEEEEDDDDELSDAELGDSLCLVALVEPLL